MSRPIKFFWILGLISLVISSCREQSSGCCKDSYATNFDAMSEENSCCVYPKLQFSINHILEIEPDSFLSINDLDEGLIINEQSEADSFIVLQSSWFFRDVELFQDGEWSTMEETSILPLQDSINQDYIKNYALQDVQAYRIAEVGSTSLIGSLTGIRFNMGWKNLTLDTTSTRVVLNPTMDKLNKSNMVSPSGGIYLGKLKLLRKRDSLEITLALESDMDFIYQNLPQVTFVRGKNRRMVFNLEYNSLLKDVDINGDIEGMKSTIQDNFDNDIFELDTIY